VEVGEVSESATATSGSADPDTSNNTASSTVQVAPAADLAIQVEASDNPAATDRPFEYVVTVRNLGPIDATGVVVTNTLPPGVRFDSASTDQAAIPSRSGSDVTVTVDTLRAGTSASLTIVVTATAPPGSTLEDSASVSGQQADPDSSNNMFTLGVPIRGVSDLGISASAQPDSLEVGRPLTYTILVTNHGPDDEPSATFTTPLPSGVTLDHATSTQ